MEFHFQFSKSRKIVFGIVIALALGLCIWSKGPIWLFPVFAAAYTAIHFSEITVKQEYVPGFWEKLTGAKTDGKGKKDGKKNIFSRMTVTWNNLLGWVTAILLFLAGPWLSTWCMQRIILEDELIAKSPASLYYYNMLFVAILYVAVLILVGRVSWAWIISHTLILIVGFADFYVYEFRQNEIAVGDLTTIGTGLSVVSRYRFTMPQRGSMVILLSILIFSLLLKFKFRFRHPILVRIPLILLLVWLVPFANAKIANKVTQTWEKKGTYKNGFIVNFLLGVRDSKVKVPSGYSAEAIEELEEEYASASENVTTGVDGVKPTIITIMDESFADFRLIGDLETNQEVTPFIDSLKENTTKGYALSSVFGAKTPNSEWEYLTGNSMAFLPGGSVPYQQYIDEQPFSLVSTLKNEGYTAVAMHPYYSTGWRRSTVYPWIGFDEMMFLDTGGFNENNVLRDYVTDQELFDRIIERYEAKGEDENLFYMAVTMQNHGGYKDTYDNFDQDVWPLGDEYYADASQYLSLIHQTDKAVENLITYFENVDEPVEIIFFGDHYPSLSTQFIKSLNGKGTSGLTLTELEALFSVPFFIWTNYDTPEETVEITSLCYLGTMALEKAGIALPAFNQFQKDLMEVIPAINVRGYYSLENGKFVHVSDAEGTEKEWIRKYRYLQYNSMFDTEGRSELFSPYIAGE